jgi:O-antigen ligase
MWCFVVMSIKRLRRNWIPWIFSGLAFLVLMVVLSNAMIRFALRDYGVGGTRYVVTESTGETATDAEFSLIPESRRPIWEAAATAFADNYLWGIGTENFVLYSGIGHTHSIYWSWFLDYGVVGLVCWLWLGWLAWVLYRQSRRGPEGGLQLAGVCLAGGMVAFGVHGLVDFNYNFWSLWTFAGLAVGSIYAGQAAQKQGEGSPA